MDIKQLQKERSEIHNAFWNNKLPKRLPVDVGLYHHIYIEYSGKNFIEAQYDYSILKDSADAFCREIYSDTCPLTGGGRPKYASFHQLLGAESFVMSSGGQMQHPEVSSMEADEYDELTADPFAFIADKVIPRLFKNMDPGNPVKTAKAVQMALSSQDADNAAIAALSSPLTEKYGYYPGAPKNSGGSTRAPFDYIADMMRGFSNTCMDLRRIDKRKLADASDAVTPLMFSLGMPKTPNPEGSVNIALHMPSFMRSDDFETVFLPSLMKLIRDYAASGVRCNVFCEDDYTRLIDYLQDFPSGTYLRFETADPKLFKEKLGKKFFLGGFFPTNLLRLGSESQCLDKIKEVLDIMLPGGGYMFGFDKNPMTINDVNFGNLKAVTEYMRTSAVYENPGESFGSVLNSENFSCSPDAGIYKSKYSLDLGEFLAENPYVPETAFSRFAGLDRAADKFFISLLA